VDKDPYLPFFYNGICVESDVFDSLPAEPQPCERICEEKLWKFQMSLTSTEGTMESTTTTPELTTRHHGVDYNNP